MKKLLILTTILTTLWSNQELNIDLDNDGKKDKVFLKCNDTQCRIVCSFASSKKEKIQSSVLEKYDSHISFLEKTKSGFKYNLNFMRGGMSFQFRYEKKSHKVRLIGMEHYEFGNASHIGRGESSINLLTGKYLSKWAYADLEKHKLITPKPTVKKLKLSKIYLSDFSFIIDEYYEIDEHRRATFSPKNKSINLTTFLENKFPDYKLYKKKLADLNNDSILDYIVILESKKKGKPYAELDDAYGRKVLFVSKNKEAIDGFKILAKNDHIIGCSTCGGSTGDPFRGITAKGKYLSFEELYGACVKDFQVSTFKYNEQKKKWFLYKISIESSYCNKEINGEPKVETVVKTVKDFGVVEFSKFKD